VASLACSSRPLFSIGRCDKRPLVKSTQQETLKFPPLNQWFVDASASFIHWRGFGIIIREIRSNHLRNRPRLQLTESPQSLPTPTPTPTPTLTVLFLTGEGALACSPPVAHWRIDSRERQHQHLQQHALYCIVRTLCLDIEFIVTL
jgi:hypothetical protein